MYPNLGSGTKQPSAPPPPSSSSSSSTNPYSSGSQPPNPSGYSPYSLPNSGQQPPPQGGSGYQQAPYPPSFGPHQPSQTPYPQPSGPNQPYQSPYPSSGYPPAQPAGQQPPRPQGGGSYNSPYPSQQGGYPPNQQQQSFQNPSQSSYPQQPQGGGYNQNSYGSSSINDRIRTIAGKYEISNTLAQRLQMLEQFELVVLCDDSGSMNTPVDGTQRTRWDELRAIVQIVIEIGTVFDSNGVDVHFLNRAPMLNVTDSRQVVESFTQRPQGLTPLTSALRRIFQSVASKPGSDKRLLVFVATDGAPTDDKGNVDIAGLQNLMNNERRSNTTHVSFLACTDDESSVAYLSQWDRTMINVDVTDDYKTERDEVRRTRGPQFPFSFGDYIAKALLGAIDPQMDVLDEFVNNNNSGRR